MVLQFRACEQPFERDVSGHVMPSLYAQAGPERFNTEKMIL